MGSLGMLQCGNHRPTEVVQSDAASVRADKPEHFFLQRYREAVSVLMPGEVVHAAFLTGDGRMVILGTKGYIELRKYIDIAGRPGKDHLFIVNKDGPRHIDCSNVDMPFGRQFLDDVRNRTETAMPQVRAFKAMELALTAQKLAEVGTVWQQ